MVDLVLESANQGLPLTWSALHIVADAIIKGYDRESYIPCYGQTFCIVLRVYSF